MQVPVTSKLVAAADHLAHAVPHARRRRAQRAAARTHCAQRLPLLGGERLRRLCDHRMACHGAARTGDVGRRHRALRIDSLTVSS